MPDDTADHLPLQPDGSLDLVALGASIFDRPVLPPVMVDPTDLHGDLHECRDLAADLHSTREILLVALADVATLTKALAAATATISSQREELRRYTASAVSGQDA